MRIQTRCRLYGQAPPYCSHCPLENQEPSHHPPHRPSSPTPPTPASSSSSFTTHPSKMPPPPPHLPIPSLQRLPLPLPQRLRNPLPQLEVSIPDIPAPRPIAPFHGVVLLVVPFLVARPAPLGRGPGLSAVFAEGAGGEGVGVWRGRQRLGD